LDELIASAVFPVLIAANSDAAASHTSVCDAYSEEVATEMNALWEKLQGSGLTEKIKLKLIYVPLCDKDALNKAFDDRLKGLQIV